MKKVSLILSFILFINLLSISQINDWKSENYIGISASGISSSLFLLYNDTTKQATFENPYLNSLSGGFLFKNFSERIVGISINLKYIKKGGYSQFYINTDLVETPSISYLYKSSYIELTPLMNIRIGKKRSKVNIYAGPHLARLINDEMILLSETTENYKKTLDYKIEFGLNIGGGYSFEFNRNNIELKFIYSHGITNVFNPEISNKYIWFNQNQVLSVSLSYYYKL